MGSEFSAKCWDIPLCTETSSKSGSGATTLPSVHLGKNLGCRLGKFIELKKFYEILIFFNL